MELIALVVGSVQGDPGITISVKCLYALHIKHIWSNVLIFVLCIFDHCSLVLNSLVSKLYKSLIYINPELNNTSFQNKFLNLLCFAFKIVRVSFKNKIYMFFFKYLFYNYDPPIGFCRGKELLNPCKFSCFTEGRKCNIFCPPIL